MTEKMKLFLAAAVLLVAGLACQVAAELGCYSRGDTWVNTEWSDGKRVPPHCVPKENFEEQETVLEQNSADNDDASHLDPAASDDCDATALLKITHDPPEYAEYEDGTKTCEYNLTITNTHSASVWLLVDMHIFDMDDGTEYYQWTEGEHAKASGLERTFRAYYSTYTDTDYLGPGGELPVRAAAIYKTDECTPLKENFDYVEQIAVPITEYCP